MFMRVGETTLMNPFPGQKESINVDDAMMLGEFSIFCTRFVARVLLKLSKTENSPYTC